LFLNDINVPLDRHRNRDKESQMIFIIIISVSGPSSEVAQDLNSNYGPNCTLDKCELNVIPHNI
jgi:hypothetical protein